MTDAAYAFSLPEWGTADADPASAPLDLTPYPQLSELQALPIDPAGRHRPLRERPRDPAPTPSDAGVLCVLATLLLVFWIGLGLFVAWMAAGCDGRPRQDGHRPDHPVAERSFTSTCSTRPTRASRSATSHRGSPMPAASPASATASTRSPSTVGMPAFSCRGTSLSRR